MYIVHGTPTRGPTSSAISYQKLNHVTFNAAILFNSITFVNAIRHNSAMLYPLVNYVP